MEHRWKILFVAVAAVTCSWLHAQTCVPGQVNTAFGPSGSTGYVQASPLFTDQTGNNFGAPEGFAIDSNDNVYFPIIASANSATVLFGVVRFTKAGTMDRTFGGFGYVIPANQGATGNPTSVAVDVQDRLVYVEASGTEFRVSRFLSTGVPDSAFGNGGSSAVPVSNMFSPLIGVTTQTDGKIVVATSASNGSTSSQQPLIARLNDDGSLDSGFGSNGLRSIAPVGFTQSGRASGAAVMPDGRIVLGGTLFPAGVAQPFAARLLPDGSPDPTFGSNGISAPNFALETYGRKLALQGDGKVLLGGSAVDASGNTMMSAVRVNVDGSLDTQFGGNGQALSANGPAAFAIALQGNGRILLAGIDFSSSSATVMRLTAKGQIDATFGNAGVAELLPPTTTFSSAGGIAVTSGGKLISRMFVAYSTPGYGTNLLFSLCH